MKTITEYLSGQFDEELNVLVAEAREYKYVVPSTDMKWGERQRRFEFSHVYELPPFSTSLDACRELLADLTEEEMDAFIDALSGIIGDTHSFYAAFRQMLTATARQICVAYLIAKGVLK